jgi:hypothetical protein
MIFFPPPFFCFVIVLQKTFFPLCFKKKKPKQLERHNIITTMIATEATTEYKQYIFKTS